MAEAAGLVIGVVALVGTFKDCVDLFIYINSARSMPRDYAILETKLEIERVLFLQWADRVRLLSPDHYDPRLDDPTQSKVLSATLGSIRSLLSESQNFRDSYGLIPEPNRDLRDNDYQMVSGRQVTTQATSAISGSRLIRFIEDFEKLKISSKERHVSPIGKFRWIIQDKDKFEKLIQELSYFITKLNELVPDNAKHIATMINNDLKKENLQMLSLVYDASVNNESAVAAIAEQNRCEKRVLYSLWFRTMDDRRYSVATPHSRTLHWTLEPQEALESDTEWDNLSEWLQTNTGIYWVCGKAGSGKSTLMKYLHEHERTRSLLKEWAAGCPLTVASFFFWYLGTNEQKTLDGLSRALLFYILDKNPSNIEDLLPNTWQEAKRSKSDEIRPPSAAEMRHAFEELRSGRTKIESHKFCFLIDGLDEYVGDVRMGISFIKNLAKSENIKIIFSSRPIPTCADAFSSEPQLHLQDLTKADIASYVDAEVGFHPYMDTLRHMDPINAPKIVEGLVSKASGVFLWIVLACRSVLEGFASCDYVPDLLRRVDELPPELEDLFGHMLRKVDPRYQGRCAKLIRTCYENKLIPNSPMIQSIAMALADHRDQEYLKAIRAKGIPIRDRLSTCKNFEQRLRSHSCGLLEFVRPTHGHKGRCFCRTKDKNSHNTMIDSTIDFMHRSVFEFLNNPGTWQFDCLQIREEGYEPYSCLANISLQLLYIAKDAGQEILFIRRIISYAILADKSSTDTKHPIIPVLTELMNRGQDTPCGISYIALELGMINFHRAYQSREDTGPFPLLYHALARPCLYSGVQVPSTMVVDWDEQRLQETVKYVLDIGVNPNEEFKTQTGKSMTPWIYWLVALCDKSMMTASDADVTILLINSGADIGASTKAVGEPLSGFARQMLSRMGKRHDGDIEDKIRYIIELSETAEQVFLDGSSESELDDTFEDALSDFTDSSSPQLKEYPAGVGIKRNISLDDLHQSASQRRGPKE
ncbi:hypothetical protein F4820DRAFT_276599 [Hypoxylon rubiginosum]|uniref:Uncharacterized protein n=1 Tax=Hypoxylon rubiginosum TaxID=110542 RepID=A0ACB9Z3V7_9PEZI|nr:hypothetical protein F4820DRAFT_276599 [Hypoxylon rubiginosum]